MGFTLNDPEFGGANEEEQKETAKFSSVLAFFNIEKTEMADLGWSV